MPNRTFLSLSATILLAFLLGQSGAALAAGKPAKKPENKTGYEGPVITIDDIKLLPPAADAKPVADEKNVRPIEGGKEYFAAGEWEVLPRVRVFIAPPSTVIIRANKLTDPNPDPVTGSVYYNPTERKFHQTPSKDRREMKIMDGPSTAINFAEDMDNHQPTSEMAIIGSFHGGRIILHTVVPRGKPEADAFVQDVLARLTVVRKDKKKAD